jgi:hypothetical protein
VAHSRAYTTVREWVRVSGTIRSVNSQETPRDELGGEECKANVQRGKKKKKKKQFTSPHSIIHRGDVN